METAIYVLIGALAATLAFLIVLPAISARAQRLARARAALTAPLSAAEARAERDALRARHAVETALIERRADEAQERLAQAQIALGRQSAEIVARDETLAEREAELKRRGGEIARLTAELRDRDAEISAREIALHDYAGQREAAERATAQAAQRLKERQMQFDEAQAELEGRIASLSRELSATRRDSDVALATSQARVAELRRELAESEAATERLKDSPAGDPTELERLREELKAAQTRDDGDRVLREAIVRLGRELIEARLEAARPAASVLSEP